MKSLIFFSSDFYLWIIKVSNLLSHLCFFCSLKISSTMEVNMDWHRPVWRSIVDLIMNKTWCTTIRSNRRMLSRRVITATSPAPTQHRHLFWTGENVSFVFYEQTLAMHLKLMFFCRIRWHSGRSHKKTVDRSRVVQSRSKCLTCLEYLLLISCMSSLGNFYGIIDN